MAVRRRERFRSEGPRPAVSAASQRLTAVSTATQLNARISGTEHALQESSPWLVGSGSPGTTRNVALAVVEPLGPQEECPLERPVRRQSMGEVVQVGHKV